MLISCCRTICSLKRACRLDMRRCFKHYVCICDAYRRKLVISIHAVSQPQHPACRGIPTDIHPSTGKSALETVLTVLHAGGKFGGDSSSNGNGNGSSSSGYRVSGGLHGVGISVVNALSEELQVEVLRNGSLYKQSFSRGVPMTDLTEEPAPAGSYATGTKVCAGFCGMCSFILYFF